MDNTLYLKISKRLSISKETKHFKPLEKNISLMNFLLEIEKNLYQCAAHRICRHTL
jgi:hypothetical protein